MSWDLTINQPITGSITADRGKAAFMLLIDTLYNHVDWTLVAYGDGSTFSKLVTGITPNPFGAFPDISGVGSGSWTVFTNADGVQVIIKSGVSAYNNEFYWSVDGDYLASPGPWDDAGNSTRPGSVSPPTDEVSLGLTSYSGSGAYYLSVAMGTDGCSFIMFGKSGTYKYCTTLIKCLYTKAGDTHPYWSYHAGNGSAVFDDGSLSSPSAAKSYSYHPVGGVLQYRLMDITGYDHLMQDIPVDPYTGNEQLLESLCACDRDVAYRHIRGTVPGFMRNSCTRSMGDTFNGGEYMCMGDYSVPWNGTTTALL